MGVTQSAKKSTKRSISKGSVMPYTLHWQDRFTRVTYPEQATVDPVLCSGSFYRLSDGLNNLRLQVTSEQFTKIWSAAVAGAELLFPEFHADILLLLLQAASCPIETENECFEFLPSAPFISFLPDNPYISGDTSAGWNKEAWFLWPSFSSLFPDWIANWLDNAVSEITGYENTDVLFNIESIPVNPIDAWLNGGGVLPTIEIQFAGTGVIEVTLLSFPLGGKAIIELDEMPNVLDILTGGIIDEGSFLVELNRDVVNFPPDEYPLINIEIPVENTGNHTLYIVFIPVVNDELIPIGFGGGIRSVEFCGFAEEQTMGIEQVIWDGCALKTVMNGVETEVVTAEEIQACMDIPSGGGGSFSGLAGTTENVSLGSDVNFTNTTYDTTASGQFVHNFTKAHALIGLKAVIVNSGNNDTFIRPIMVDVAGLQSWNGVNSTEDRNRGTAGRPVLAWDVFDGYDTGININMRIEKRVSAGTGTINANSDVEWVIIEFDDPSELFLEDIRYKDGVLEKKLAGVWTSVVDIAALLAPIQATANASLVIANSAQSTANSAVSVNSAQNVRLNEIEADIDDLQLSVGQINITVANHESRIDALEAASGASEAWSFEYDFQASQHGWAATSSVYVAGQGFRADSGIGFQITKSGLTIFDQRITHVKMEFSSVSGVGVVQDTEARFQVFGSVGNIRLSHAGSTTNWIKCDTLGQTFTPSIAINAISGQYYLRKITILGRGANVYFS